MPVPFFQLTSTLGASNLIDYKLGQLHPLPPIALRAAFTTFVATSYCAGKCSHSEVVTKYSCNALLAPFTAYQRRQRTIPIYAPQGN